MKVCCDVTPPSSHPGPAWRGEEVDDGCSLHLHSSYNFLSCHWLSVPLSDHTPLPPVPTPPTTTTTSPPPSPPPHGPFLLRRLRLSLGCFEHSLPSRSFFFFLVFLLGAGASQRCGVAACLPCLPPRLVPPLPPPSKGGGGGGGVGGGGGGVRSAYPPLSSLPPAFSVQLTLIAWSYCLN